VITTVNAISDKSETLLPGSGCSMGLTYQLNTNNVLGLSYGAVLTSQPTNLNPAENKLDELTYQKTLLRRSTLIRLNYITNTPYPHR